VLNRIIAAVLIYNIQRLHNKVTSLAIMSVWLQKSMINRKQHKSWQLAS